MTHAFSSGLDVLYPRHCEGCGASSVGHNMHLCWDCLSQAVYVKDPFCSCCGDPVFGAVEHTFECSWCRRTHPSFLQARSAVRFRGKVKELLHAFKYNNGCHLSGDLAGLLAGCVQAHYSDVRFDGVAYVPLHPKKARERSYNQARLLAVDTARRLELPVLHRSLRRTRMTDTQTRLNAEERKRNVRGAFEVVMPDWIEGRRVLLLDDVMTTGATVSECAFVLMNAGAVSVHVATVARG
jgi:ComF family protein